MLPFDDCGFCHGEPVGNAAEWLDGKPRPPAPCPRCGLTTLEDGSQHEERLHCKLGSAYTTDDGQEIPEFTLYRCSCRCGWEGAAWYVGRDRAQAHFDQHLTVKVETHAAT